MRVFKIIISSSDLADSERQTTLGQVIQRITLPATLLQDIVTEVHLDSQRYVLLVFPFNDYVLRAICLMSLTSQIQLRRRLGLQCRAAVCR